ncbi:uncharacterized protein PV09_06449 [Verruconis gallopava]|uniref:Uncharacterized protein n=1 Tax=Verruconis gallopava TaxID=253628 RepID=A0A0D1YNL4_9PEZI|nr:uncharacterized protein PV09_06449 [Verruconis gallopava]KIW02302.1 hypothetical protein PV09_06449 [Verruconis gallopava]
MSEKNIVTAQGAEKAPVGELQPSDATEVRDKSSDVPKAPFSNYWRIMSYGSRTDHALMLLAFAASAGSGVAMPLMNIVLGNLVGNFNKFFIPGSGTTETEFKSSVNHFSLIIFGLFLGKFVLTYISMFCFRVAGLRISAAMRLSYMHSLFAQSVAKLDLVSVGSVSETITTSANSIQTSISDRLAYFFQAIAVIISAYAVSFAWSWQMTLISSAQLVFLLLVFGVTTPATLKAQQRVDKTDTKHATVAFEIFSSIRTVFSLGAERVLSDRYTRLVDESGRWGKRVAPLLGVQLSPMYFATFSSFALTFWTGLKFYADGTISTVNQVIVAFFSVLVIISVLGGIVSPIMTIVKAISASTSFFEMIDSKRIPADGLKAPEVSAHEDIELSGVSFAYPSRKGVQVLNNFDAVFRKGQITALVGPSGSGKSTIVALLERWYSLGDQDSSASGPSSSINNGEEEESGQPELLEKVHNSGMIKCGGRNIDTFDLKWWRSQIGFVQQEPFLFNDTIKNNVSFGLLGTQWEDVTDEEKLQRVKEACREAFADEFIEKLPQGYDTLVGESGIKLSGGQRQRLAIARSIIRRPVILILDEATSAIDVRSEAIVQKALDEVSKSRTTIVIAHRLATIQKADHIIVMRDGLKVEEGTHEELLSDELGLYSGLVRAQKIQAEVRELEGEAEEEHPNELLRRKSTGVHPSAQVADDVERTINFKQGFFGSVGILLYEQRTKWILFIFTLLAAMGAGGSYALQAWFFAKLVQVFTFTGQKLAKSRDHWSLMFFILALANTVFYGTLGYSAGMISAATSSSTRRDYFLNTIRQPITYFDLQENASGSVVARLSSDPKNLGELLGLNGAFPLISIFNMISCIVISFYFGWKLTLVIFLTAMPVLLICQFIKLRNEFQFNDMNAQVFASSSAFATEAIGAFRTVSSLTMEEQILSKYTTMLSDQVKASTKRATYAMLINAFCDSVELAAMALTFWYGGQLLASREYEPTQFYVIYTAIIVGSIAAGQFFSAAPSIAVATASANRILGLRLLNRTDENSPDRLIPKESKDGAHVRLERVTLKYASRDDPTFRNLSLDIPAGSFAAFVGPSGCGKTSVISLLERFYEPSSGQVLVNEVDIRKIPLASYRQTVSLVAQEPRLFSGTIRDNLTLGMTDPDEATDERIHQACRDAEIHEFITSLPEGYQTELGSNTATALSGGQKQRLCLARALLRQPKLLLLDEATSSLDSQSEKLVQQAIERLAGQRNMTVIAVAHRLATIQKADTIFVFGESEVGTGARILERGSHAELMRLRGAYWQMCQAQALDR